MTIRTSRKTVTFRRPFTLKGVNVELPAGAYTVETDEEPLEGISILAYRRISTVLYVPGKPGDRVLERMLTIDPKALDAAMERDRAGAETSVGLDAHRRTLTKATMQRREEDDRQAIERGEDEGMIVHPG
ncbi:MAG: hypothetical protein OEU26_17585 [Candidatus Tectomicrobia bacterium]|nr:hypothetical protein [Candidatus Tectomicrobia bacterium]